MALSVHKTIFKMSSWYFIEMYYRSIQYVPHKMIGPNFLVFELWPFEYCIKKKLECTITQ